MKTEREKAMEDARRAFDRLVREHIGNTVPSIGILEVPADAQPLIDKVDAVLQAPAEPAVPSVPEAVRRLIGNLVYALDTIVQEDDYYGERAANHAAGALLELRPQIDELDRTLSQCGES